MGLVQDGEGGGQWVVERMDLEQVRTGEVYPYTYIHSALHICMEEYETCSILGYLAVITLKLVHYCVHCPTECPGHSGYSTTATVRRHIKPHIGNLYSVESMHMNHSCTHMHRF